MADRWHQAIGAKVSAVPLRDYVLSERASIELRSTEYAHRGVTLTSAHIRTISPEE